ncbi:MAG: FAD-dependent oxidoreductase [Nocardioides sp.]
MTDLTADSVAQYQEMGVFTRSGGARGGPDRGADGGLRRRMSSARSWGIDAQLVTPDEVQEMVPFLEKDVIVGGFYTPAWAWWCSLRAGTIMRRSAPWS